MKPKTDISCFEESDYEKLRRQKIQENQRMLRELFPEFRVSRQREGLFCASPGKARKRLSENCPNVHHSAQKQTVISFSVRKNPARSCRKNGRLSNELHEECFVDTNLGMNPPPLIIKWPGKLMKGVEIKRRPSTDADQEYRLKRATKRAHYDVTEEDLILVAERTSDKRYDAVDGTTCHQCRQKTDDLKTVCRAVDCVGIRGQFCGPCLKNRYGEDAKEAIMNPSWCCPPCRGICNCSFCMKKRGRSATGILIHTARDCGFNDVKSFLGD